MRWFSWNGLRFSLFCLLPVRNSCTFEENLYAKANDRIESKVAAAEGDIC